MNTQSEAPQRLHPLTLLLRTLKSLPALAFAVISVTVGTQGSGPLEGVITIVLFLLYGMVAMPLIVTHYVKFSYHVTLHEIVIRSGVFRRRKRNIPLERIQNVEITRSLLPRMMGLATVKIMTAGSNEAEGVLEYTSHETALDIRDSLRRQPESASVQETPSDTDDVLIAMPFRRVLLSGAFRFSLVYIALIFSGLYYLQQISGVTEQDILDWFGGDQAGELASAAQRLLWIVVPATLLAAGLLAWISGMIVTIARLYKFRLRRSDDKLVRSHGLLTLQEVTLPVKRIQALVVRSNLLMRAFGWFRLELQTVGHDVSKRAGRMAIPLARLSEITEIGPQIKPFALPDSYERVSRLTIRRTFFRYSMALSVLVVPVGLFLWGWAWWGMFLLPFLGYLAWLQYRNHGYSFSGDTLYVRRGVFQRYIWIVSAERFQAFKINGTVLQRRLRLRTVTVDTAGSGLLRYPHIVDLPVATARAITDQLYAGLRRNVTP